MHSAHVDVTSAFAFFWIFDAHLLPSTGLEPACIQLPFHRFRKPRGYDGELSKLSKETQNLKFCSRSCAVRTNNRLYPKRVKKIRIVESNGKSRLIVKPQTLGDLKKKYSESGVHGSWWYSEVRSAARRQNSGRPKKCQACDYDKHVEYCHIKPIRSFSDDTLIVEINKPENIAILCRNHHWELDHGHLSL